MIDNHQFSQPKEEKKKNKIKKLGKIFSGVKSKNNDLLDQVENLNLEDSENALDFECYDMGQVTEIKRQLDQLADYEKMHKQTQMQALSDEDLDKALRMASVMEPVQDVTELDAEYLDEEESKESEQP